MTKGLSQMLGLPHLDDLLSSRNEMPSPPPEEPKPEMEEDVDVSSMLDAATKAAEHMRLMNGTQHTRESEEVRAEVLRHAKDLMDYAYNAEPRAQRGIFEIAASMYNTALSAADSKRDHQLKAMKLMLDFQRLQLDREKLATSRGEKTGETIDAEVNVISEDRNEMIKRIRESKK